MAKAFKVEPDGSFYIGKRRHLIPETFSDRQVHSYQTLLETIPDSPSGPTMKAETRRRQRNYLLRRSLLVVVPGLPWKALQSLPLVSVQTIHDWIARYRPELAGEVGTLMT